MPRLMEENSLVFGQVMARARSVFGRAREHLAHLQCELDGAFFACVQALIQLEGHVLFAGVGKSACVAKKLAATFASLGMPSFFIHPTEMGHGDLGNVTAKDIVILVSYSGETGELVSILPVLKARSRCLIGLLGNIDSTMGRLVDHCLSIGAVEEACHLGLAPTTSTTACFVLGDALAVCAAEQRGFQSHDFAKSHPSGRLGQLLTLRAADVMVPKDACALVSVHDNVLNSVLSMAQKATGVSVIEAEGEVIGIQPASLIAQATMSNRDLSLVTNQQYCMPLKVKLLADMLLQEVVSVLRHVPGRYHPVYDQGLFVGLLDIDPWLVKED
jgi:arabinose-5-phosphate isomerase